VIDWRIDTQGLETASRRFAGAERIYREEIGRSSPEASRALYNATEREMPEKTGQAKQGLTVVTEPIPNGVRIVAEVRNVPYIRFVVEGTRAHEIRPRFKKVLRFTAGGRVVFAMRVRHPGTKANDFFERGSQRARLPVRRVYQATNRRILVRLVGGR
jgi:hypothetical protein